MKINENTSMRDAFFNEIHEIAKRDKDIVVISADMGAPALDKFREDFKKRFFNIGIAEQNMIAVASGLASEGKKVYTFAIAPFITSRCYEFTKLNAGVMKFPIKLVGVGAGFSYDDSGPTHHTIEDISIMRVIPNLEIYSPSDSITSRGLVRLVNDSQNPVYIRLDRKVLPRIYDESEEFKEGFKELKKGEDICIVSTGNMVHNALKISDRMERLNKAIGVIDVYRLKPINPKLSEALSNYHQIISLEEHLLDGGLGSIISENITDNKIPVNLQRIGLKNYIYAYGGRENIQKVCGIDIDSVIEKNFKPEIKFSLQEKIDFMENF